MPRAEARARAQASPRNISALSHLKVKYIYELCFIASTIVMLLLRSRLYAYCVFWCVKENLCSQYFPHLYYRLRNF